MITYYACCFAIVLLLTQPAFAGKVNGTLSSRLDFYPEHADGTASEGRSAEVKIDAFHDFEGRNRSAKSLSEAERKCRRVSY